ncbi:MAG: ThuA domain-containing protein, partial [Acidobacteriaceae bacterium]
MRSSRPLALVLTPIFALAASALTIRAQSTPPPHADTVHRKHVLVIGETKGFEHDSVTDAMVAVYEMGKETGLWDTVIRTDTELLTKKNLG